MAEESSIVDQPPMTSPLLSESVYLCDHSAESLTKLSLAELQEESLYLKSHTGRISTRITRELGKRDDLTDQLLQKFDVVTALLKSFAFNIKGASTLKFSLTPLGEDGYRPWCAAWRVISRIGNGINKQWRRDLWSALVHYHLSDLDWPAVLDKVFVEEKTEEDTEWDQKILKDLHASGTAECTSSEDELKLKNVLLAYARYNKSVGYCQGFNILTMVILRVTSGDEVLSFKILVFLIDRVFPKEFFTHKLEGLSVDIAVFRDLMSFYLPEVSDHLEGIREAASKMARSPQRGYSSNTSATSEREGDRNAMMYEPPLTNLFTMQWFLTLYATILPKETTLRVWDAIFLEGSEVVFHTALVIWRLFQSDLLMVETTADFYQTMSLLSAHLKKGKIITSNEFMNLLYMYIDEVQNGDLNSLPSPKELRDRYTYNVSPFLIPGRALSTTESAGKDGVSLPKKCPLPSRGASYLATWTFRLPESKSALQTKPPRLHLEQGKKKSSKTDYSKSTSGVNLEGRGVVLESTSVDLSSEYPQATMEVTSLLYSMEISDQINHYTMKTQILPQVSSSEDNKGPSGEITHSQPLFGSNTVAKTPTGTPSVAGAHQNWKTMGELANFLVVHSKSS